MKVSSAVIPLLFGILNAVFAQSQENDDCFITAPMQGTILKIGEQITVSWSSAHDAKFNAITLTRKGPKVGAAQNDNSHNIKYVGSDVDTAPGKFTFALSPDFAPSDDYYLTLGEGLHECTVGPLRLMPAALVNNTPDTRVSAKISHQVYGYSAAATGALADRPTREMQQKEDAMMIDRTKKEGITNKMPGSEITSDGMGRSQYVVPGIMAAFTLASAFMVSMS